MSRTVTGATVLAALLVILSGGCTRRDESAKAVSSSGSRPSAAEVAQPVTLPDVSRLAASVQAQVRERHAALMVKRADTTTRPEDLGAAYGDLGLILMASEFYQAAASCYLTAQAVAPDDVRWPYYLGHLYRLQGEPVKAAQFFSRALELRPADTPTLIWLGETHLDQNRPDQAEPMFLRALSREPGSAAALSGVGRTALAKQDFARAVDHLERALAADPRALGLHYSLAAAYRGMGQLDRASVHVARRGVGRPAPRDPLMEAYETILQSPLSFETQGMRALESGQVAQAADLFQKGLALAPDDPKLLHRLGTVLFMQGDAAGSVRQFEAALRLAPGFPRAHFGLGMVLHMGGQKAGAIDHFAAAVKSQPDYVEARLALADALGSAGRLQESLSHSARIVELEPSLAEAWVMYARTLVILKRYSEARDRLNEARRIHPSDAALTDLLVRLLAAAPDDQLRDGRQAMALMQELLKSSPPLDVREPMAMTLAELGQFEEAVRWQREAIAAATQAGRADVARLMSDNLALYEQRRPSRRPLRESTSPAPPASPRNRGSF